jgi:hypothetical protein
MAEGSVCIGLRAFAGVEPMIRPIKKTLQDALSTPIMEGLLEALPRPARDAAVGVIVPAWWGHEQLKGLLRRFSPSVMRAT